MHYAEERTSASTVVINGGREEDRRNKDTRDKGYDTKTFSEYPLYSFVILSKTFQSISNSNFNIIQ